MRHIIIEQATEGEAYYQATIDFETETGAITGAKQHLENLLACLDWIFDGEFTYQVKLADIALNQRKFCADAGTVLTAQQKHIGDQIVTRCSRRK